MDDILNGREIEKLAWEVFGKWCDKWWSDHPEDEKDYYDLSLMYGREEE